MKVEKVPEKRKKRTDTPLKAIKKPCRECAGDSPKEVWLCLSKDCSLFPFRQGHDPGRKGKGGPMRKNHELSSSFRDENQ